MSCRCITISCTSRGSNLRSQHDLYCNIHLKLLEDTDYAYYFLINVSSLLIIIQEFCGAQKGHVTFKMCVLRGDSFEQRKKYFFRTAKETLKD